ncbi:hypothetical protein J9303_00895 [Bacillaceae bacterium Marseille-Q3522]|nr:hypothetical protein [Bacillaceae bacterium Marseille-Q3522]
MSLNNLIESTLEPIGIPVSFQTYPGEETTYITYFEYNQRGALFAEDEEKRTAYSIQVDVWSQVDYTDVVKQVKSKLKATGFIRQYEGEIYEDETETYHKILRFNYAQ